MSDVLIHPARPARRAGAGVPAAALAAVPASALAIILAMILAVASLAGAPRAEAAGAVASRITGFSASPSAVYTGNAITIQGQAQRSAGRVWAKTGTVTLNVWFDPDGSRPNARIRSITSNSSGYFRTTFAASVSGKWSVAVVGSPALRTSGSSQKYVQVRTPGWTRPVTRSSCPAWAPIKGNASSHIYHLPGQRFYTRTNPEICFSTESAARSAGYRKSKV